MEFHERVEKLIIAICGNKRGNRTAFSEKTGIPLTSLDKLTKAKGDPQLSTLRRIYDTTGVNPEWLISGIGDMFSSGKINKSDVDGKVPFYDIEVSAGQLPLLNQDKKEVPVGYLDLPEFKGCDFAVPARGDSMADFIEHGDWVIFKRYDQSAYINFGPAYGVVTKQDFMVKYIARGSDKSHVELRSHNSDLRYSPFEIKLTDILFLYKVMGVVKKPNF